MKHEWLAGELRKIAHGCDVTGIRGSQHIRHAADILDGTEPLKARHNPEVCVDTMEYAEQLKAENEALRAALHKAGYEAGDRSNY